MMRRMPKNTSTLGTAKTIVPSELKPGEYVPWG